MRRHVNEACCGNERREHLENERSRTRREHEVEERDTQDKAERLQCQDVSQEEKKKKIHFYYLQKQKKEEEGVIN